MLRTDRICIWILIVSFALVLPSLKYVKVTDEACAAALGALTLLDCVVNRRWRDYRLLWIIMGIMALYAVYSLTVLRYNTPAAILADCIIQLKPFVPFVVLLAVHPVLGPGDRKVLKVIAIVNAAVTFGLLCAGNRVITATIEHVTYTGITLFLSAMIYLYCSIDGEGRVDRRSLIVVTAMLVAGLGCTRAKYYAIFIISIFFLYVYSPGMMRRVTATHLLAVLALVVLVAVAGWSKFSYYFLTGNSTKFDPEVMESFARPVLYFTAGLILTDHIPFGTGLASFASYQSAAASYSGVYNEYGIQNVYGLSESNPAFVCDAFYPSLAQFGLAGVILFVWFWCYLYSFLRRMMRCNPLLYRYQFVVGSLIICFLLIESIGSTTLVQSPGLTAMMMLGLVCARGAELSAPAESDKGWTRNLKIIIR